MAKILFFLVVLLGTSGSASAVETSVEVIPATREAAPTMSPIRYEKKISLLSVFTEMPATSLHGLKMSATRESLPYWGLILSSTAILYHYDENILRDIQKQGRDLGIGNEDNTRETFRIGPWPVRFPSDTGSAMYFLGDGITHFSIAGSLISYGYFSDELRPYNTGLQLVHGIAVSTIFSQVLKRSFGRESPVRKTEYRGKWQPFPSISEYGDNTSKYDAMPSGHVMTATLTFTILIENYPEYLYILRPVEITWLTLLGWQMANNGVHWVSDYPLGIAMGYVFGKAAARLGRTDTEPEEVDKVSWLFTPSYERGIAMTNLIVSF